MIRHSPHLRLGLDAHRMNDPRDVARQTATVARLLARFTADEADGRRVFQVLADEVGMGKTFVALGAAFSLLEALRGGAAPEDFAGCAPKVLIVSPTNATLFQKWQSEVGEFLQRAVAPEARPAVAAWFQRPARALTRWDDVARALCDRDGPAVVVTNMGAFGRSLVDDDAKLRAMLGACFRFWGNRLPVDDRARLLEGGPEGWPADPYALSASVVGRVPFSEDELVAALGRMAGWGDGGRADEALAVATDLANPYRHRRAEDFQQLLGRLRALYRPAVSACLPTIPLVIVDEAHNWKGLRNGADRFMALCAPWTLRLLLLSATPFQLHPSETLRLFEVAESVGGSPDPTRAAALRAHVRQARTATVATVLDSATRASEALAERWRALSEAGSLDTAELAALWEHPALVTARDRLAALAERAGAASAAETRALAAAAVAAVPHPDARPFLATALELFAHNRDLSQELGEYVIRHRRPAGHRLFLVGEETLKPALARPRPDRHLLHDAPGMDVHGEAELAQYVLMRCVQAAKSAGTGAGTSSLGASVTGAWSTLFDSAEGRLLAALPPGSTAELYGGLLRELVGPDANGDSEADREHPKMKPVVAQTAAAWRRGEKVLLFCTRTKTARRLEAMLNAAITRELAAAEQAIGGPDVIRQIRAGLTGRERALMASGLDTVLRSFHVARGLPFDAEATLRLQDDELEGLARLSIRAGLEADWETARVDRVFLHRAVEHLVARRLLRAGPAELLRPLLTELADEAWVRFPYGRAPATTSVAGDDEEDRAHDTGVATTYPLDRPADEDAVARLAELLRERRARARAQGQIALLDTPALAPSLWFAGSPDWQARTHGFLWALTDGERGRDWADRARVFSALRKVVRWRELLLRMLAGVGARGDEDWASTIVSAAHRPLPGQTESLADRLLVLLEDLASSSGQLTDPTTSRGRLFTATRQAAREPVLLVDGDVQGETRASRFAGFNSPLPPEILVCTSVGQEGIDLHRYCRNVVHYDMDWNPAVLEQRTGRVDRIGSKTFRDRRRDPSVLLEIAVPYLAGTYDERMYAEVRLRAQAFEILTGGELSREGDRAGADDPESEAATELGLTLVPLPEGMVRDLQVRLEAPPDPPAGPG